MSEKPVILVFTRYYLPGYRAGGPIRTIANMVDRLSDEFAFRIVCLDRDLGDVSSYSSVVTNVWTSVGKAQVMYVAPSAIGISAIVRIARSTPHDVVYLNSFFDRNFSQKVLLCNHLGRLQGKPIVLAPRGEFAEAALRLKWLRKTIFLKLAGSIGFLDGLIWQASSSIEAADIRARIPALRPTIKSGREKLTDYVAIAPNLTSDEVDEIACRPYEHLAPGGQLRICFLSRISPMKNLDFALQVLAKVTFPVQFSIYGPAEDQSYWEACQNLIEALPSHVSVKYEGLVEHAQVVSEMARHSMFFLPSRGENFGHVIFEALRAGLILLISDKTPWQKLESKQLGWSLPLEDPNQFVRAIAKAASLSERELEQAANRARMFAKAMTNDQSAATASRDLFLRAIGETTR